MNRDELIQDWKQKINKLSPEHRQQVIGALPAHVGYYIATGQVPLDRIFDKEYEHLIHPATNSLRKLVVIND